MRRPAVFAALAVFAVFAASPLLAQGGRARGLKLYISADMEGVVGTVTSDQLGPGGFEYERFRRFMTDEVVVAITAARAAGATDILVSDSHGNGENLLIEQLPEDVTVVRSWPRPLMMMQGIDSTFHAALFIGYHAGAVVKWNASFHAARTLTPAAAAKLIGDKVTAALRRLDRFRPFVLRAPITLDIRFKHYRPAEMLAYLPIVARPDAHSIRYVGPDMMAISKFLEFVMTYAVTLEP